MQHLDLMAVIEDRQGTKSIFITSQFPVAAWHEIIAELTLCDAILDRITAKFARLALKGESLRKYICFYSIVLPAKQILQVGSTSRNRGQYRRNTHSG
jgi:hypothetical protein